MRNEIINHSDIQLAICSIMYFVWVAFSLLGASDTTQGKRSAVFRISLADTVLS